MKISLVILLFIIIVAGLAFLTYSPIIEAPDKEQIPEAASSPRKPAAADKELAFCSDPWPPYAGHADAEDEGYIVDILREVYEPLGYKVRYVNVPWSRCIRDTRDGIFNALAGADILEVPDFVFPGETIGITRPAFFVRGNKNWNFQGIKSLDRIKLGSIQDYTYETELDEYIRRYQDTDRVLIVKGNDALIRLITSVQESRIDAFIENAPVVYHTFRQMGISPDELREAGAPNIGVLLFIPFSPKFVESREYAQIYDTRIQELRKSGRLDEILSKYKTDDWLTEAARIKKVQSQQ